MVGRIFLIVLICPFYSSSRGQIKIIDFNTKNVIPFCLILKSGTNDYMITAEDGILHEKNFKNIRPNDSLEFSHISYETRLIAARLLLSSDTFYLFPKANILPSVNIFSGKKKRQKIGNYKWFGQFNYPPLFESLTCIKIENKDYEYKIIKKLRYFISSKGRPDAPFKPVLFSLDENGEVSENLIKNSILTKADCQQCWYEVDVSMLDIMKPKYGCMLCLEILPQKYYDISLPPNKSRKHKFPTRQVTNLGAYNLGVLPCKSWSFDKSHNRKWHLLNNTYLLMQLEIE